MKHLKMIGLAVVAAMALMAMGASSASATTLSIGGKAQTTDVTLEASAAGSIKLEKTDGTFANTCTVSKVVGTDSTKTSGTVVSGPISSLTFGSCKTEKVVVDAPGTLSVEQIGTSINGTVKSSGAKVTVPSPFGALTCETGTGADIGTLTGVNSTAEHASMDIKAVLNCGFLAPSSIWEGAYTVTSPTGLGVTS